MFLFSQCARKKAIETENFEIVIEVKEAYIQREIPGLEELKPQLKLYLIINHNEWVNIEKVAILAENLVLKKYKNGYTATFEKEELLTFKGSSVSGILFHTVDQKQREIPIEFKVKEDLYLP